MQTTTRTISIGDCHGCSQALAAVLEAISPTPTDCIVPLGDFVDRGMDSQGVIEQLIGLRNRCRLIPILGNHEAILLEALSDRSALRLWLEFGGITTLDSYGFGGDLKLIPKDHIAFLRSCQDFHETERHFFCHANYQANVPLDRQTWESLRWKTLEELPPKPHHSGKIAVVGHTPQTNGEILDLGFLKCLDTNCCGGGWLTALDVVSGQVWQANERGELRVR